MSHYTVCKTSLRDLDSLFKALQEMGWSKDQILVYNEPVHLYGYRGDRRADKAHVVIRREFVGAASNDLGFRKEADGTFTAVISEYDARRFNATWLAKLKRAYTKHLSIKKLKQMGAAFVTEINKDGQIILQGQVFVS